MIIRHLTQKDAILFRETRRYALVEYPEAFAQTEAEWLSLPEKDVAARTRNLYQPARRFVIGAFEDDDMVGMIGFLQVERSKMRHKGFIWGVYVRPENQGLGIGGQLLDATLNDIRQIAELRLVNLSVGAENDTAVALYKSRGFETYGTESAALILNSRFIDQYHMVLFL